MSFISDSTMGMDKSDSGGSIQHPLVEQEVIPIGGSSSEGTCHETSNNESSSFERLVDSCRVGGGTSPPRRRAQPSTAPLHEESPSPFSFEGNENDWW